MVERYGSKNENVTNWSKHRMKGWRRETESNEINRHFILISTEGQIHRGALSHFVSQTHRQSFLRNKDKMKKEETKNRTKFSLFTFIVRQKNVLRVYNGPSENYRVTFEWSAGVSKFSKEQICYFQRKNKKFFENQREKKKRKIEIFCRNYIENNI